MRNPFHRYLLAGAVGTAAHYVVLAALLGLQVIPVTATAMGATAGAIINFGLCRHWVFGAERGKRWLQASRFLVATFISVCINSATMTLLSGSFGVWMAQLVATFVAFLVGYLMNRYWTFTLLQRHPV